MSFTELKKEVCRQNLRLFEQKLVILTEGNVSQVSADRKYFAIKPSGVLYEELTPSKIIVLDLSGRIVEGKGKPSTDAPTHAEMYLEKKEISGIAHTHSPFATIFSQMKKSIPCYGTTHADAFSGEVPVTRLLTEEEIFDDFETNTGKVICEVIDPTKHRAVLVSGHGPFAFGTSAKDAVDHALILEKVAMMALMGEYEGPLQDSLLKHYHFNRKHGKGKHKYYGQG
ncbi:MAG: hypothetical protein A2836_01890 [Candidatus Taylorbacteria bacterium RIFCSPHIGHO2_01_FULL_45_63]|uniref:L-ribulose-5-phosphate 4-epimerase n=1 Tax=Candidatus Taylorbacteria bacterium RIFCSPHIGHO2_02_FULL_45_35 TaxID=1802311 RepID=A0A1G2MX86_9BACT|nr:MAG: hypothetical protein A2836_01890 [Candidatus Taylorbacteria bacterium RIFCSPHIGHO2_01_FULL_45_63]OHA27662.1 MAG: hypothetical protein A3D56_00505 [Candidatus Taylorbacteria bacterium RIFCSPHIGHO2_02_FULL_45_35]OHA34783.1 MAG: hypothetical protein A3A22_02005 [Candidatus Taylorbacteria bacterium RIFCSPLOWO2_01_FULL_45_34b]